MVDVSPAACESGIEGPVCLTPAAWGRWLSGRGPLSLEAVLLYLQVSLRGRRPGDVRPLHFWAPVPGAAVPAWLCVTESRPPGREGRAVAVVHLPGEEYPFSWGE